MSHDATSNIQTGHAHASHDPQTSNTKYGMLDKTLTIYLLGFFLCLILTAVPFAAVQYAGYSHNKTLAHIFIAAIAQFVVQIICFLRLNWRSEQAQLNSFSFVFSLVITTVVISGSLWIMWNLNYHMMGH